MQNAQQKINGLIKWGIKPGLERIKKLLEKIGNPEKDLKIVHIAGTNGKGSVCTFLSNILRNSGIKTGLFISPYVIKFEERMQINGEYISSLELDLILEEIWPYVEQMQKQEEYLTEFEVLTAVAFLWFAKNNCELIILEVGLGGLLDSTNVIEKPMVCGITSISYDHMNILGKTLEEIAFQKAGIIKKNIPVVVAPQGDPNIVKTICYYANTLKSHIILKNMQEIKILNETLTSTKFIYKNEEFSISLLGEHQLKNILVVFGIIEILQEKGFNIPKQKLKEAISNTYFPARLQILQKDPYIILDGAHNQAGAKVLYDFTKNFFKTPKPIFLMGMLADKQVDEVLKIILPLASNLIITKPNSSRAILSTDFLNIAKNYILAENIKIEENVKLALDLAKSIAKPDQAIIICGSLYLAQSILELLN